MSCVIWWGEGDPDSGRRDQKGPRAKRRSREHGSGSAVSLGANKSHLGDCAPGVSQQTFSLLEQFQHTVRLLISTASSEHDSIHSFICSLSGVAAASVLIWCVACWCWVILFLSCPFRPLLCAEGCCQPFVTGIVKLIYSLCNKFTLNFLPSWRTNEFGVILLSVSLCSSPSGSIRSTSSSWPHCVAAVSLFNLSFQLPLQLALPFYYSLTRFSVYTEKRWPSCYPPNPPPLTPAAFFFPFSYQNTVNTNP